MTSHPDADPRARDGGFLETLDGDGYAAMRERALLINRSDRGRIRVSGPRARELLAGMVTNDVAALDPGAGIYACALTPKGRIVADLRIYADADGLLIECPPRARDGWAAMVRKYVNPRWAPFEDVSERLRHFGIFGPAARRVIAEVSGLNEELLANLAPHAHAKGAIDGHDTVIARTPELRAEGYGLFVSAEAGVPTWRRLLDAGAEAGERDTWEIARVEAGQPEWGLDMDESTLPQEANMDALGAISYTKGCYVGQEVVARIHFRGHVNRHLRGLRFGHPRGAPSGTELFSAEGKLVGDVRTSVHSPTLGAIALAMVRREIAAGEELIARGDELGEMRAAVSELPFAS